MRNPLAFAVLFFNAGFKSLYHIKSGLGEERGLEIKTYEIVLFASVCGEESV